MSDEDIRIKLTADETGAVNAFKRLKKEVATNDEGLKQLSSQGKQTGQALKDAAGVLGPEFQILGDRIDHITGALGDVKGASLATKGALAGLVAVGAFEVGKMLGDIIFQTQQWEEANKRAVEAMTSQAGFLNKQSQDRIAREIQIANLAETQEQRRNELISLRQRLIEQQTQAELDMVEAMKAATEAQGNDMLGFGTQDNAVAEEGLRIAKERVAQLREQVALVEREQSGATGQAAELEARQAAAAKRAEAERDAARAIEERARAEEQAQAAADRLAQTQDNYLAGLEAELVKLKEGEEAYLRLSLAKQGFTDETINAAVAMKAEADALREQARRAGETGGQGGAAGQSQRMTMPGQIQASQQRFITRGTGSSEMQKLIDAQKAAAKLQADALAEAKRLREAVERIPRE